MAPEFTPQWSDNAQPRRPLAGEVDIWALPLAIDAAQQSALWEVLSPDEQQRAERFLFDDHRRRFVACRGRVRHILARYLGRAADTLRFRYSGLGKPELEREAHDPRLPFNVTHSSELALLAVGADGELGADIERRRDIRNMHGLAERFFSGQESSRLFQLKPESQPEAFFRIWTRKEAILKATGKGLTFPLDRVTVSFERDEPAALLALGDDPLEASRWNLHHLIPNPDYIAAIATRYTPKAFHYWTWQEDA